MLGRRRRSIELSQQWRPKEKARNFYSAHNGEFWHVSVSERQRSRPCSQNLRVPFLRTVLPPEVGESARAMASMARQKRSYLHHQGEFQHQNCTVGTVHDSDREGVVKIFVRHSYHSNELYYITRHNFFPTRRVTNYPKAYVHPKNQIASPLRKCLVGSI